MCLLGRLSEDPHPWAPAIAPILIGSNPCLLAPRVPVLSLARSSFWGGLLLFLALCAKLCYSHLENMTNV